MIHLSDLFLEIKYGDELRELGYTILPLLNNAEVSRLLMLHDDLKKTAGLGMQFYTSIWSNNEDHRKKADQGIKKILIPALKTYLKDIQPVFANLMVKASGEDSSLLPHQDWSFVDEPEFDSATVWIPLVDVSHVNGNLQVVPGSHLRYKSYLRPRFGDAPFNREEEAFNLIDVPMKAGHALVLNSRLIHASPPNLSGFERIAASVVIAPAAAKIKHWVSDLEGPFEFEVDETFFWRFSCYDKLEKLKNYSRSEK